MIKKSHFLFLTVLISSLLFSACSGAAQTQGGGSFNRNNGGNGNGPTTSPETKTALGILSMEGTDQAVTVDQAKTLLPLYKAAKVLVANSASSPAEVQALFQQVDENLTPAQAQVIDKLDTSPQNLRTLMANLGIQSGPLSSGTRTAGNNSGGFEPGGPGGPGGGGIPGGGGGGITTRATSAVGGGAVRQTINTGLLNAVIDLLSKRAGVATATSTSEPGAQTSTTPAPSEAAPGIQTTPAASAAATDSQALSASTPVGSLFTPVPATVAPTPAG